MIGDSTLTVDSDRDVTIKGKHLKGRAGQWELLTRKNVKHEKITADELKSYKKILKMTNAHLTGYERSVNIHITRGVKFREGIAPLFPLTRRRVIESELRRKWVTYYYDQ